MPTTFRRVLGVLSALLLMTGANSSSSAAQPAPGATWTPEASAGLGLGHVFRFEDQTFGDRPNVSGSLGIHHRSGLGVEIEVNRTLGLSPAPAPCGVVIDGVPAACVGNAHDGVRAAASASLSVHYRLRSWRHQPYVTAGLALLRTQSVWSLTVVDGAEVRQSEQNLRDTGLGPDVGVGVRFRLTPSLAIAPEIRSLGARWRSRVNLAVTRVSLRATYAWVRPVR